MKIGLFLLWPELTEIGKLSLMLSVSDTER